MCHGAACRCLGRRGGATVVDTGDRARPRCPPYVVVTRGHVSWRPRFHRGIVPLTRRQCTRNRASAAATQHRPYHRPHHRPHRRRGGAHQSCQPTVTAALPRGRRCGGHTAHVPRLPAASAVAPAPSCPPNLTTSPPRGRPKLPAKLPCDPRGVYRYSSTGRRVKFTTTNMPTLSF